MSELRPETLLEDACARLREALRRQAPHLASQVEEWIDLERLRHPGFLPLFALPLWVERSLRGDADRQLQADLATSTLNGYCYARLIDDVMDGDDPRALRLLPVAAVFHTEFQLVYQHRFAAAHPFWELFRQAWHRSHDAAAEDAGHAVVEQKAFERVAARKLAAIVIPVAATCLLCRAEELVPEWSAACDCLAAFHQFADDLSDWVADRGAGRSTYLLGEAERRRRPEQSVEAWICQDGLAWGAARLREYGSALVRAARALGCPELERHAADRLQELERRIAELAPALRALGRVVFDEPETGV